jgi:hypothetical protein
MGATRHIGMSPMWWRRIVWLGLMSVILIGAFSKTAHAQDQEPDEYRRVIFVPGIDFLDNVVIRDGEGPHNTCERAFKNTFAATVSYLKEPAPYWSFSRRLYRNEEFLAFSYSNKWTKFGLPPSIQIAKLPDDPAVTSAANCDKRNDYSGAETREHVALSAYKFQAQFKKWRSDCPSCRFEILCHSLGGAVVTYWSKNIADDADLAYIHGIVTIDSPINGIERLKFKIAPIEQEGSIWREIIVKFFGDAGGEAGLALLGEKTSLDSTLFSENSFLDRLKQEPLRVDITCVGNEYDVLVIPVYSLRYSCGYYFGQYSEPVDLQRVLILKELALNTHTQPLSHPAVLKAIDLMLVNNGYFWRTHAPLRVEAIADRDSRLMSISRFPLVAPNAPIELSFRLRNNGIHPWHPGDDKLQLISGDTFRFASITELTQEVPQSKLIDFTLKFAAPQEPGIYTGEWQMHYRGQPYGSRVFFSVIVLSKEQQNPGGAISVYLKKAWDDTTASVNQLVERMKHEAEQLVQREIERQMQNLINSLCGLPIGAIVVSSVITLLRNREKHGRNCRQRSK